MKKKQTTSKIPILTDEDKLLKLVIEAQKRGWEVDYPIETLFYMDKVNMVYFNAVMTFHVNLEHILYDKDFAKALFGTDNQLRINSGNHFFCPPCRLSTFKCPNCKKDGFDKKRGSMISLWEWHLQKAVIHPDPIDYYYQNIF